MNASELSAKVSAVTGLNRKTIELSLRATAAIIAQALHDGAEVTLPGIGKLAVKHTPERSGLHPATRQPITIPAKRKPLFRPAKQLVDVLAD